MGLKQLYGTLRKLDRYADGNIYQFDGDTIFIGNQDRVLGMLREEENILELSFDPSCPYSDKVALVKLLRKAQPDGTLVIGPDVNLLQVKLHIISPEKS